MLSIEDVMYVSTEDLMNELDKRLGDAIDSGEWEYVSRIPRSGLTWLILERLELREELEMLPMAIMFRPCRGRPTEWRDRALLKKYIRVCEDMGVNCGNVRRWLK